MQLVFLPRLSERNTVSICTQFSSLVVSSIARKIRFCIRLLASMSMFLYSNVFILNYILSVSTFTSFTVCCMLCILLSVDLRHGTISIRATCLSSVFKSLKSSFVTRAFWFANWVPTYGMSLSLVFNQLKGIIVAFIITLVHLFTCFDSQTLWSSLCKHHRRQCRFSISTRWLTLSCLAYTPIVVFKLLGFRT